MFKKDNIENEMRKTEFTLLYLIENHLSQHKTLTARQYLELKTNLKAIDVMTQSYGIEK